MESGFLYLLAADLLLFGHVLFVAFVVLGLALILIGKPCDWDWVRNLWFQSRLRLSVDSLLVSDFASEGDNGEVLWENRLDYFIGKLEVRFRTALIERSGDNGGNMLAILSVNRRF